MKLIIDIDEESLKEVIRCGLFLNPRDKENLVNSIKHGTPIPDNATNGDVIKALFPKIKIKKFPTFLRVIEGEEYIPMTYEWWNSPYKRGETNE